VVYNLCHGIVMSCNRMVTDFLYKNMYNEVVQVVLYFYSSITIKNFD